MSTISRRILASVTMVAFGVGLVACGPPAKKKADPPRPAQNGAQLKIKNIRYVALGDSFTAAPLVSAAQKYDQCMRSQENYPSQVAAALQVKSFTDMSCAGAQTKHFLENQYPEVPAQFSGLTPRTNLVTVSMGGNDFGMYGTLVGQCAFMKGLDPSGAPCRTALEMGASETKGFRGHIRTIEDRLVQAIAQIRKRSPRAKVIVVGYPQMVPKAGTCPTLPLATGDYAYVHWMNQLLDGALRKAATRANATFVDIYTPSLRHTICSKVPWINGNQGKPNALVFHPFLNEQTAIAKLVESKVRQAH